MRASHKMLVAAVTLLLGLGAAAAQTVEPITPVYPPYPYRAGHYPTADSYYELPPYADIAPSYYRGRYFLTRRERGRYRYVPYIFTDSNYRD